MNARINVVIITACTYSLLEFASLERDIKRNGVFGLYEKDVLFQLYFICMLVLNWNGSILIRQRIIIIIYTPPSQLHVEKSKVSKIISDYTKSNTRIDDLIYSHSPTTLQPSS